LDDLAAAGGDGLSYGTGCHVAGYDVCRYDFVDAW